MTNRIPILLSSTLSVLLTQAAYSRDEPAACAAGAARFEKRYARIAALIETRNFAVQKFDESDGSIPADRLIAIGSVRLWRDGDIARFLSRYTYRSMQKGRLVERPESFERLIEQERSLHVSRNPTTGQYQGPNLIAETGKSNNAALLRTLENVGFFVFAGGRIDVNGPTLLERIAAVTPTFQEDRLNGRATVRLDFEDVWGIHSIWFDPSCDYHPVQVFQRKLLRHWVRPNFRLDKVPDSPNYVRPTGYEWQITLSELHRVGREWVAGGFQTSAKFTSSQGKTSESKVVARITEISLDPRPAGGRFTLATQIPNGAKVLLDGQEQINYEWRDGEIVKAVDSSAAQTLATQEFHRSTQWWFWPSALILASALLASILWVLSRRRGGVQ